MVKDKFSEKVELNMEYYAEFNYPGTFMPETSIVQVTEEEFNNPKLIAVKAKKNAYSFTLFSRLEGKTQGKYMVTSDRIPILKTFFIGGNVYTLDEVKKLFPDKKTLISNMQDQWPKVILCRTKNWQPFQENDVLFPETS